MNPIANFLIRLGLWSAAAFVAVNVLAAAGFSRLAYTSLPDASPSVRWTAAALAFLIVQAGSVPFWLPLTIATAADETIRRAGLAKHVLDGIFRILAVAWPHAEHLRVGSTIPAEAMTHVRASASTFAEQQSARLPRFLRPFGRWTLKAVSWVMIRVMIGRLMARENADGSLQILDIPRLLGSAYDAALRRQLWFFALLIATASITSQTLAIRGVLALCRPSSPAISPVETAELE